MKNLSLPRISVPSGGGAIRGIAESSHADVFSGSAHIDIPLPLSPCREVEPQLTLSYNSAGGKGIFGIGFAVDLPSIERKTSKGIPRYDDSDIFVLAGEGDLVPKLVEASPGDWQTVEQIVDQDGESWHVREFRPRRDHAFDKIEYWRSLDSGLSYWRHTDHENRSSTFGKSAAARVADPDDPKRIFRWLIEEIVDAHDNRTLFSYTAGDALNEPDKTYNVGRNFSSNRYLSSIQYGNYVYDIGGGPVEQFAFTLVFDYGEYDVDQPENPPGQWAARQDPFSTYRAGFEIRTNRLVRNILMYHQLHDEFNNQRFLTRALHLDYSDNPVISRLTAVREVGYRRSADATYSTKELPPLALDFSGFDPAGSSFQKLTIPDAGTFANEAFSAAFRPVDLDGSGIPGILYTDDTTTLYWRALGNGQYAAPSPPAVFPNIGAMLSESAAALADIDGDGLPELVTEQALHGGYFRARRDEGWNTWHNFPAYPNASALAEAELVDLNGDGLADRLLAEEQGLLFYQSQGAEGFAPAQRLPLLEDLPAWNSVYERELTAFADIFGDGLQHRLRLRTGIVECWPSLGYGRFGARVVLDNAPCFDNSFNARNLHLVDLDGSGTADLIYVHSDRLDVYINQGGNGFSEAISISLPERFGDSDRISFADVTGNGSTCLIFSKMLPVARHYYFSFVGEPVEADYQSGVKPYLLTEVRNNFGASTRFLYRCSTRFYLDDLSQGRQWATKIPFPVHVLASIETLDEITGTKSQSRYAYHDGYYDPAEREFRGFAYVEHWDSADYDSFSQTGLHSDPGAAVQHSAERHSAPAYTRSWFNTGAFEQAAALEANFERDRYQGDSEARAVMPNSIDPAVDNNDAETLRQAYAALRGELLRQEVYADDEQPGLSEHPYALSETRYHVRLEQARADRRFAAFHVYPLENLHFEYERNPADPRVQHDLTLAVDDFGNILDTCSVYYPRRLVLSSHENPSEAVHAEQKELKIAAERRAFVNHTNGFRHIAVLNEQRSFEIAGLDLQGAMYFSYDDLQQQLQQAFGQILAFNESLSGLSPQARLLSWQQRYYWNDAQDAALPLGQLTARALMHHQEEAIVPDAWLGQAFNNKVDAQMMGDEANAILRDGYWWASGPVLHYLSGANQFYLPWKTIDLGGSDLDFDHRTTLSYDAPYYLMAVREERHLSDTEALVTSQEIDYHALRPRRLTDRNANVTQIFYDPLAVPSAVARHGTVEGVNKGEPEATSFAFPANTSAADIVGDPGTYLQEMTAVYFNDPLSWMNSATPSHSLILHRHQHESELAPGEESLVEIQLQYFDGLVRNLQEKFKVEPGAARISSGPNEGQIEAVSERWRMTGMTLYNNKELPVEQYHPYFSDTSNYEDQRQLTGAGETIPPTVTVYDPLQRIIRIDTPKGFLSRMEFSAWWQKLYDEDDTIMDSDYYLANIGDESPEFANEHDALVKAAVFYNTPEEKVLDTMGRAFLDVRVNALPQPDSSIDYEYLATQRSFDINGHILSLTDPRILASGTAQVNLRNVYDMRGAIVKAESIDAGMRVSLNNRHNRTVLIWDARGFRHRLSYDNLQRLTEVRIVGSDAQSNVLDHSVHKLVYGESAADASDYNLRGQPVTIYDQAGVLHYDSYDLNGELLRQRRSLRTDYKSEVDWSNIPSVDLEPDEFISGNVYDALGRPTQLIGADNSQTDVSYALGGPQRQIDLTLPGEPSQTVVNNIDYDAYGHRLSIDYGNQVTTTFTYEETTSHLLTLKSERPALGMGGGPRETLIQDLAYFYDPRGLITRQYDRSAQAVFCDQTSATKLRDYNYDALYRLSSASGRQHPGIQEDTWRTELKQSPIMSLCPMPNIPLEAYSRSFSYDNGDNLTSIEHTALSASWTRTEQIEADSNKLLNESYDAAGNQLSGPQLEEIIWNYRNLPAAIVYTTHPDGTKDADYYLYNSRGRRIRVVEERKGSGGIEKVITDRITVNAFEQKRIYNVVGADTTTILDRQSLRINLGRELAAIADIWLKDDHAIETDVSGVYSLRYQLSDALGSIGLELDEDAEVSSYEEFYPFGGTAIIAATESRSALRKTRRYSGKERDDSSALYYYGARYYAPWLGRWLSPDSAGIVDGLNFYAFVRNDPVNFVDREGKMGDKALGKGGAKRERRTPGVSSAASFQATSLAAAELDKRRPGANKGRSLKSIRTVPSAKDSRFKALVHAARQAKEKQGVFFDGPTEVRGLGRVRVKSRTAPRDPSAHRKHFRRMTGGEASATRYMESIDMKVEDQYEILHGVGVGEAGSDAQDEDNLAAASHGANTFMIPFDKAISGNSEVLVDTSFKMRAGTHRAESVHMQYFHEDRPHEPFFEMTVDGDLPKLTRGQFEELEGRAAVFSDPATLSAAVLLTNLSDGSVPP